MEGIKKRFSFGRMNIFKRIKIDKSKLSHRLILLGVILALCVALEFLIFSFKGIFMIDTDDYTTDFLPLPEDSAIELNHMKNAEYRFDFPGEGIYSIRIGSVLMQDPESLKILSDSGIGDIINLPIVLKVYGYDDKNENLRILLATHYILPEKELTYQDIELNLNTEPYSEITLSFSSVYANTYIEEVVVNPSSGLIGLNPLRMLVFMVIGSLLWVGYVFNFKREIFDISKKSHKAVAIATFVGCVALVAILCSVIRGDVYFQEYPFDMNTVDPYANPYKLQFDAFMKGQLSLDIPVSDEVLALENPYDASQRGGVFYLWDKAMYDGKYYTYFGIGPILNFYFPTYWLSGRIASDVIVTILYAVIATAATVLFIIGYIVIYKKRVPVSFIPISCLSVILSAGIILSVKAKVTQYYVAVIGGLAYLMLFLLFIMLAVNSKHKKRRPVLFACASLSFAFLFLTRVNIAVLGAIIAVPAVYFCIWKGKRGMSVDDDGIIVRTTKEKVIDLSCLASFAFVAVCFTFIYNYLRFDSIFEFGTTYQLTVSDISQNGFCFDRMPQMIYHTLFQPLETGVTFPYFTVGDIYELSNHGGYLYLDVNFGLFAIPLCLGLFLSVFVFKSKKKTSLAKSLAAAVILGIVVICFVNYFLGGVNMRYTTDMTLLACVASVLFMISLNESVEGSDGYGAVILVEKLFMLASAFISFMMLISYATPFYNDPTLFKAIYQMFE